MLDSALSLGSFNLLGGQKLQIQPTGIVSLGIILNKCLDGLDNVIMKFIL